MRRAATVMTVVLTAILWFCSDSTAIAQVPNGNAFGGSSRQPTIEDYLRNSLRAARPEQQAFIKRVLAEVEAERLTANRVVAVSRYAQRRHPDYPFPFFERAMRFEAAKLDIALPSVQAIRSTANPFND